MLYLEALRIGHRKEAVALEEDRFAATPRQIIGKHTLAPVDDDAPGADIGGGEPEF